MRDDGRPGRVEEDDLSQHSLDELEEALDMVKTEEQEEDSRLDLMTEIHLLKARKLTKDRRRSGGVEGQRKRVKTSPNKDRSSDNEGSKSESLRWDGVEEGRRAGDGPERGGQVEEVPGGKTMGPLVGAVTRDAEGEEVQLHPATLEASSPQCKVPDLVDLADSEEDTDMEEVVLAKTEELLAAVASDPGRAAELLKELGMVRVEEEPDSDAGLYSEGEGWAAVLA